MQTKTFLFVNNTIIQYYDKTLGLFAWEMVYKICFDFKTNGKWNICIFAPSSQIYAVGS